MFVAIDPITSPFSNPDVTVRHCLSAAEAKAGFATVLEVYFRRGTRAPRKGETLGTYTDGSTLYAMAPSR